MPTTPGFRQVVPPHPTPPGDGTRCGDCRGCAPGEALPPAVPPAAIALGAAGLFLMPVAAGVVGAWWGRADAATQLAGGLVGFASGMGLTWAGYRLLRRRKESDP